VSERERLIPRLLRVYRDDPDGGIHGVAEWLLRQWRQEARIKQANQTLATGKGESHRQWYINRQGQTMVVIGPQPRKVMMGQRGDLDRLRVEGNYAIASKEVTVEQFLRFRKGHKYSKGHDPTGDCPVNEVSWHDAAAYCNWLSQQEGITEDQHCYVPASPGKSAGEMKPAPNCLKRTGYRLPTWAEWDFACRAGAETRWHWGEAEELTRMYAWHYNNSRECRPVGKLKPNDMGLYDMHGNVAEWCQDLIKRPNESKDSAPVCGGMFYLHAEQISDGHSMEVMCKHPGVGFRLARTIR
jgi:formylglycine-generating enzyme required for sulfatase activity